MEENLSQWLILDTISGVLTLIAQLLLAIYGIIFNYANRFKYPLKQNSPLLTIACLLVLTFQIVILFTSRMLVGNNFFHKNCFYNENRGAIEVLSYFYTFCEEFVLMAYFMKMIRVLAAYSQFIYKIGHSFLKFQFLLLLICLIYSGSIIAIEASLRGQIQDEQSSNNLYYFFCLRTVNQIFWSFIYVKFGFTFFIYFFAYFMTVKIHSTMNFRSQWRFALILSIIQSGSYEIMLSFQVSPVQPAYYISMLVTVIQTITIVFYLGKVTHVCPIPSSKDTINDNFQVLYGIEQVKQSIMYYFEANNCSYLIKAYNLCEEAKQQQFYYPEKAIKRLVLQILKDRRQFGFEIDEIKKNNYNFDCEGFKILVGKILEQCQQKFQRGWYRTKQRQHFAYLWAKNAEMNVRFQNLRIDI